MKIDTKEEDGRLIVTMNEPRLDAYNADSLKSQLVDIIQKGHKYIVLDVSKLEFIDSKGLGALVTLHKIMNVDGCMCICGMTKHVSNLFRLTRLDKYLKLFDTVGDEVQWINALK
jgi:anti-sigma B factor antagonist